MTDLWKDRDWSPMLLKEIEKPFNSKDYIFELKFDGFRTLLFATNKEIYIQSRNKQNLTNIFPELQEIREYIPERKKVIFDGEIVIFENNKPSFSKLQTRMHIKEESKRKKASQENPVVFIAFDILYENKSLTNLPLIKRKKYLEKYEDTDTFIKVKIIEEKGIPFFNSICKRDLEGIVAKNKKGLYHINERTDDFIKIKNKKQETFLIGGYEVKKNNILSLSIGEYQKDKKFHFVGKVAISKKRDIYKKVLDSPKSKNYFIDFQEDINYIKPTIPCHITYLERTKQNHLRHPVLQETKRKER